MCIRRVFSKMAIIFVAQLFLVLLISCVTTAEEGWFANIFRDRVFVFLLIPIYLYGSAVLKQYINVQKMVRIGARQSVLWIEICQQYLYTICFLGSWFLMILVASIVKYAPIETYSIWEIWNIFLRYCLGCCLLCNVLLIFEYSEKKNIKANAYLISYIIFALDVIVIYPESLIHTPFKILIIFSWILYGGEMGYIALIIWLCITLGYLQIWNKKRDIIC